MEGHDLNISLVPLLKTFLHYIDRTLADHSFEVVIIHIVVNDIISNKSSPDFNHFLKNIKNIVQKCRSYGKENICIYKNTDFRFNSEDPNENLRTNYERIL